MSVEKQKMLFEEKKVCFQIREKIVNNYFFKNRHLISINVLKEPNINLPDYCDKQNPPFYKFSFLFENEKSKKINSENDFKYSEENGINNFNQNSLDKFLMNIENEENFSPSVKNRFEVFEDSYKAIKDNSRKIMTMITSTNLYSQKLSKIIETKLETQKIKMGNEFQNDVLSELQFNNSKNLKDFEKMRKELNMIILGQSTLISQYEKYIQSLQEKNESLMKDKNMISQKNLEYLEEKNKLDKELQINTFNSSIVEKNYKSKITQLSFEKRNLLEKIIKLQEQIENFKNEKNDLMMISEKLQELEHKKQNFILDSKNIQSTIASLNSKFESTREELRFYKDKEKNEKFENKKLLEEIDSLKIKFSEEKKLLLQENINLKNKIRELENNLENKNNKNKPSNSPGFLLSYISDNDSEKNYFKMAKKISTTNKKSNINKESKKSIKIKKFELFSDKKKDSKLIESFENSIVKCDLKNYLFNHAHLKENKEIHHSSNNAIKSFSSSRQNKNSEFDQKQINIISDYPGILEKEKNNVKKENFYFQNNKKSFSQPQLKNKEIISNLTFHNNPLNKFVYFQDDNKNNENPQEEQIMKKNYSFDQTEKLFNKFKVNTQNENDNFSNQKNNEPSFAKNPFDYNYRNINAENTFQKNYKFFKINNGSKQENAIEKDFYYRDNTVNNNNKIEFLINNSKIDKKDYFNTKISLKEERNVYYIDNYKNRKEYKKEIIPLNYNIKKNQNIKMPIKRNYENNFFNKEKIHLNLKSENIRNNYHDESYEQNIRNVVCNPRKNTNIIPSSRSTEIRKNYQKEILRNEKNKQYLIPNYYKNEKKIILKNDYFDNRETYLEKRYQDENINPNQILYYNYPGKTIVRKINERSVSEPKYQTFRIESNAR